MKSNLIDQCNVSRREFIRNCSLATVALAFGSILTSRAAKTNSIAQKGAASYLFPLNQNWLFGGKFTADAMTPQFNDETFSKITLPHCVSKLSWENWNPADWEDVWIYRRHFSYLKEFNDRRVFLEFEGVMTSAMPSINGHALPNHVGGYLPFYYEITDLLEKKNVLAIAIDARWQSVPPDGNPKGPGSVDYLEASGIPRSVRLRAVPKIFIRDVFAKPINVLDASRRVEITCTIDAGILPKKPLQIKVDIMDGEVSVASVSDTFLIEKVGEVEQKLVLSNLGNIKLWDVETPKLYNIVVTLMVDKEPLHDYRTRIGFREARFEVDGFFLNGLRFRLFGLNRHEVYPYVGFAMPERVMRRDAEILRREFNCNIVRCSHYPQSPAFLDACDELGLMVWEETPGWGYLGDQAWKKLVIRDVGNMVKRDRNRPSVVIWGVRVNESKNDLPLYQQTREISKLLDGSRPTSGSMTSGSRKNWQQEWHEDVFAFDDYHSDPDGSVGIDAPLPDVPYMLSETIGQFSYGGKGFNNQYRRAGDLTLQVDQALFHAQAHEKAAAYPRFCGVIAWCAFDYSSLINAYNGVKCPGVADVFRIPKLGASFYQAQTNPKLRLIIQPNFYWDFGAHTPRGPGKNASIFSNCDRLEFFVDQKKFAIATPDRTNYPHLLYPPFFCDLEIKEAIGKNNPELRIDGYVGSSLTLSKSFSSDKGQDKLFLAADDAELFGDGIDATRLFFKVVDKYGNERAFAGGKITFEIKGPGIIIGDNPFIMDDNGGVGAVWVKSIPNSSGQIILNATHSVLGKQFFIINVQPV